MSPPKASVGAARPRRPISKLSKTGNTAAAIAAFSPAGTPSTKIGVPKIFDLIKDPTEEYPGTLTPDAWVVQPMMEIVGRFEASLKKFPPIAPGTPDP